MATNLTFDLNPLPIDIIEKFKSLESQKLNNKNNIKNEIYEKLRNLDKGSIPLYVYEYNDTFLAFIMTKKLNSIFNDPYQYKLRSDITMNDKSLIASYMREYSIIPSSVSGGVIYIQNGTIIGDFAKTALFLKNNYTSRLDHLFEKISAKAIDIVCLTYEDNKYKLVKKSSDELLTLSNNINVFSAFHKITKHLLNVKLLSIDKSSQLFGYKKLKQEMLDSGLKYKISEFHEAFKCKKDDQIRAVVEIPKDGRSYKFLADDVEFLSPDFEILTKGYNKPKDRKINEGDNVKIVDDKYLKLPKGTTVTVETIIKEGSKIFLITKVNNKKHLINIKKVKKV